MPASFPASYFDGQSSRRVPVVVEVEGDEARIRGDGVSRDLKLAELRVRPRVGQLPLRIELPQAGLLLAQADEALAAIAPAPAVGLAHRLESHIGMVALSLAGVIAVAWLAHAFGIPFLAREAAHRLPADVESHIAREGLESLDRFALRPSRISAERRQAVASAFAAMASQAGGMARTARLEFRDGNFLGPNALAIPGGVVVVTDQLVELLPDDRVAAVLAHELGHVEHRHGTRHIMQDTILGLLALALFGDASAVAAVAATVPTALLHTGYSRDFEREADRYAYDLLRRTGRSPRLMGEALQALEAENAAKGAERRRRAPKGRADIPDKPEGENVPRAPQDDDLSYISTHPATSERIRAAEKAAEEGTP